MELPRHSFISIRTLVCRWLVGGSIAGGLTIAAATAFGAPPPLRVAAGATADRTLGGEHVSARLPSGDRSFARCNECHRPDPAFSHPVDVPASVLGQASLPLDRGRITCLTCHTDQAAQPHGGGQTDHGAFLRSDPVGLGLCVQCHSGGSDRVAAHAAGLGRAHLRWQDERVSLRSYGGATLAGLDPESVSCVGCHDGSVAFDATYSLLVGQHGRIAAENMGNSHPIGVPFRTPDHWPKGASLRSRFEIDRRLRLFDDRLGCGTCHSVYSSRPNLLVMSNDRSAMCLSCHKD